MTEVSKISIITPCYNAGKYIEETINSIINQSAVKSGRVELQYIICDGGSTDRTIDIIKSISHPKIQLISEPDSGMYDALSKGFSIVSGDVMAYLNAGDLFYKRAFDVVIDIMNNRDVQWLTGMNLYYNENSDVIHASLPFRYTKLFILCGQYGKILPYIQQESTFWRANLNMHLNFQKLSRFKLAGDYYIWHSFAKAGIKLNIVESFIGGFKIHKNQLSSSITEYHKEIRLIVKPKFYSLIMAYFERVLWLIPNRIKKLLNPQHLFHYDTNEDRWK